MLKVSFMHCVGPWTTQTVASEEAGGCLKNYNIADKQPCMDLATVTAHAEGMYSLLLLLHFIIYIYYCI